MQIIEVKIKDRKKYIDLLLLGDEDRNMVNKYIYDGKMYAIDHEGSFIASILIIFKEEDVIEIKNLAVDPNYQRRGYGKFLIEFIASLYGDYFNSMIVGTGESPLTLPFYKSCGFEEYYRLENFFTDNYKEPIFEEGIQLIDMIYLRRHMI